MEPISVVMSVFRENEYDLKKSIESILTQSHSSIEFIIILDDPSNDALKKIVEDYVRIDQRIKFIINDRNMGLALSLNKGIKLAKYSIIARMDADDISEPFRLEREYNYLKEHNDIRVVSCNKIIINKKDEIISYGSKLPTNLKTTNLILKYVSVVLHPGVMFYKEDVLKIGGYRNYPCSQDHDLWLRLIDSGNNIGFLDEYLLRYRVSDRNISSTRALKQWYCHKFIQIMSKERKKNGFDSFSESNLYEYLKENKCDEKLENQRFLNGKNLFDKSRIFLGQRKYIRALISGINGIFTHKEIKFMYYEAILHKIIMKLEIRRDY